jgi:hypothetical protein
MSFDFEAGDIELDDIKSKALSEDQLAKLTQAVSKDIGSAKTVGQVLNILTRASLLAMKFGVLV